MVPGNRHRRTRSLVAAGRPACPGALEPPPPADVKARAGYRTESLSDAEWRELYFGFYDTRFSLAQLQTDEAESFIPEGEPADTGAAERNSGRELSRRLDDLRARAAAMAACGSESAQAERRDVPGESRGHDPAVCVFIGRGTGRPGPAALCPARQCSGAAARAAGSERLGGEIGDKHRDLKSHLRKLEAQAGNK